MSKKLEYFGTIFTKKAYGGWVRKIKDPKTVGLRFNREDALDLARGIVDFARKADSEDELIVTIYRKPEKNGKLRTTLNMPIK